MSEMMGNRYLLVKKIGSGGMADVFLAVDTVLNREVAVKRLRGDLSHDPVVLLRFQREANAASGLNHQNIVEVYDVGEDHGQHYIVMEMVHGSTLKALIHRRGAVDKREAVLIMHQLSNALVKAHAENVIHRDIKPQNVLVKDDGTVKIADFGIALAGDALQLTKSDSVLGSVHYLAPECSRGEGATEQSDIYALGVVFYELLTGDVPYRGETAVEIAMKHMRDPFPLIQDKNSSIPNSIANIITKATQKNKAFRYRSVQEFADDLKTCLDEDRKHEALWSPVYEDDDGTKIIERLGGVPESNGAHNDENRRKRKKNMMIGGAIVAVFLIGMLFFIFRPKPPQMVVMPSVEGKTIEEVQTLVSELGLNLDTAHTYEYSDTFEKDHVIDALPAQGSEVEIGSTVKLTVSKGLTYTIVDYTGWTVAEVDDALQNYRVNIQTRTEANRDIEPGKVIRQELLLEGEVINPDQNRTLILYVSDNVSIVIPASILGLPIADAQNTLSDMEVESTVEKLSMVNMTNAEVAALQFGVVIRTSPNVGSYYTQEDGKRITLYYYDEADKPVYEDNTDSNTTNQNNE